MANSQISSLYPGFKGYLGPKISLEYEGQIRGGHLRTEALSPHTCIGAI